MLNVVNSANALVGLDVPEGEATRHFKELTKVGLVPTRVRQQGRTSPYEVGDRWIARAPVTSATMRPYSVGTVGTVADENEALRSPFELACGLVLKNRLVKAAMSDSLGDGRGRATAEQIHLYERWSNGGAALVIIGEVQVDHRFQWCRGARWPRFPAESVPFAALQSPPRPQRRIDRGQVAGACRHRESDSTPHRSWLRGGDQDQRNGSTRWWPRGIRSADSCQLLSATTIDLIDISGGTYFAGAASSSDRSPSGPYVAEFARSAKQVTNAAVMLTGGFKTRRDAIDVIENGDADMVGLARPMVLDPDLAHNWLGPNPTDPVFPTFESPPPGAITSWYAMRLAALAHGEGATLDATPSAALEAYESRDAERVDDWNDEFSSATNRPRPAERAPRRP
jgi:hypothetical protein